LRPSALVYYLAFAGDAFLKYAASVYVYVTQEGSEGSLHNARQQIIANDYLKDCAVRVGLPQYIQSAAFAHKHWAPHNFHILPRPTDDMTQGPTKETTTTSPMKKQKYDPNTSQSLGSKAIADVTEAIIGAAYLTNGAEAALKTIKNLGIALPGVSRWDDFRRFIGKDEVWNCLTLSSSSVAAIEQVIGRPMHGRELLAQALVRAHASSSIS
jgi:endoribonuclease Dicer